MRSLRTALIVTSLLLPQLAEAVEPAVPVPDLRGTPAEILPDKKGPRRMVRFLTSSDYPPFQFLKPDQNPAGLNVDLARSICSELEFQCTIQALPWDDLLSALENGRADALIAGLRPTEELRAKADLTRPYFRLPARFAVARTAAQAEITPEALSAKKIAVVTGSAHEAYLKDFFAESEIVGFPDIAAARTALKDGKADAVFGDGVGLALWIGGTESGSCCSFAGGPYLESRYFGEGLTIAVRKGDQRLRQDLDKVLDELEEKGVLGDLYLRWFPLGIF
ncbi:ABC transporter substrate-binding protein [Terrihabitans soli]|uniref:ABC transporter substrate-binding protein n=1 Tax=Terrihabitans soli TaxID=708113 RepID=A0A6S6QKQ4_9HYPH|nr:transporter substrate-binding domain-containing protein [Terrihabitans soli]BCJ91893.1 ABC transporter substrate-binding protein [Terrihabitans soli]